MGILHSITHRWENPREESSTPRREDSSTDAKEEGKAFPPEREEKESNTSPNKEREAQISLGRAAFSFLRGVCCFPLLFCDIFHLCTCVICYCVSTALAYTFAGPLSLKAKRCLHISHHIGLHRSAHCALAPHWKRSRLLLNSLIRDSQIVRIAQQQKTLACSGKWQEKKEIYLYPSDQNFLSFVWCHGIISIFLARCCRQSYRSTYRRSKFP